MNVAPKIQCTARQMRKYEKAVKDLLKVYGEIARDAGADAISGMEAEVDIATKSGRVFTARIEITLTPRAN